MKFFLIGMPGSGKTTLAKQLAKKAGVNFLDLDEEITKKEKLSINEIFQEKGESYFRKTESELLKSLSQRQNTIVATGGGTPCFFDNLSWMKSNGVVIFINVPLENIITRIKNDSSRPIMKQKTLEDLWEERKSIYQQAHYTVSDLEGLLSLEPIRTL